MGEIGAFSMQFRDAKPSITASCSGGEKERRLITAAPAIGPVTETRTRSRCLILGVATTRLARQTIERSVETVGRPLFPLKDHNENKLSRFRAEWAS